MFKNSKVSNAAWGQHEQCHPRSTCSQTPLLAAAIGEKCAEEWEFSLFSLFASSSKIPRHLFKRPVSWLRSPQNSKPIQWRSSAARVYCRDAQMLFFPPPLSLPNPTGWAFSEPPAEELTPTASTSNVSCLVWQQRDSSEGVWLFFVVGRRDECAGSKNAQLGWSKVECMRWMKRGRLFPEALDGLGYLVVRFSPDLCFCLEPFLSVILRETETFQEL